VSQSPSDGPLGLPVIGHALAFLRDKPGFLLRCREQYGETVHLSIGGTTLLVTAPADLRHVLVTGAKRYRKSPRLIGPQARRHLGTSLFTLSDEDHARLRALTTRCFGPSRLTRCQPRLDRHCDRFADDAVRRRSIDADADIAPFVASCMADVLIAEGESQRRPGWAESLESRRLADEATFAWPMPSLTLPLAGKHRHAFSERVAAALAAADDQDALLHELLNHPEVAAAGGATAGVEQILLAAYETTTMMLAWTLDLLARHPQWQESCLHESMAERVISESLRLYPPTWLFVRVAADGDRLPSGTAVPAGTKIYLSPYASQRTSAAFPAAAAFDPDRFLPDRDVDPWRYFPFGAGARSCLGERLARRVGVTFLKSLLRRSRLSPIGHAPPRPIGRITLRPARTIRVAVAPCDESCG
jgi:cytochrome P450